MVVRKDVFEFGNELYLDGHQNEWSDLLVILFLIVIGMGQGALVTLLFNVLVTALPKRFAGEVGSLRGTTSNLAATVGSSCEGAFGRHFEPTLPSELVKQVDLNNVTFISNDQLMRAFCLRASNDPVPRPSISARVCLGLQRWLQRAARIESTSPPKSRASRWGRREPQRRRSTGWQACRQSAADAR